MKENNMRRVSRCSALSPQMMLVAGMLGLMASSSVLAVESTVTETVEGHAPTLAAEKAITVTEGTGASSVAGVLDAGDTLTVDTSKLVFTDTDGDAKDTSTPYTYQWSVGGTAVTGTKGKASSYVILAADRGKPITLQIIAHTDSGTTDPDKSAAVGATFAENSTLGITDGATSVTTTPDGTVYSVSITGFDPSSKHPMVNGILTAVPTCAGGSACTAANLQYQWKSGSGGTFTDITGATSSTYTVTKEDQKKTLKVVVTMTSGSTPPAPAPVTRRSHHR